MLGGWRKRIEQSRACASSIQRFGLPISGIGRHFADRKTLRITQMVYVKRGCRNSEGAAAVSMQDLLASHTNRGPIATRLVDKGLQHGMSELPFRDA